MVEAHFGGLMVVGIRVNLETEFRVDMESYIEMEVMFNIRDLGITECLMEKAPNSLKMDKNIKVPLNRTNSTGMVFSTRMIR
jgi:hypothetical protein